MNKRPSGLVFTVIDCARGGKGERAVEEAMDVLREKTGAGNDQLKYLLVGAENARRLNWVHYVVEKMSKQRDMAGISNKKNEAAKVLEMDADRIPTCDQVEWPVEMWSAMAVASLDRAIASAGRSLCLLDGLLTQLEQSPNGSGEA